MQQVVYRAIQTELNARLQLQAVMLGGPLILPDSGRSREGEGRSRPDAIQIGRTWELWKQRTLGR